MFKITREEKKDDLLSSSFYVLAIDIETSGNSYVTNGILSIGASLHDQNAEEKESFQVNLLLPEGRFYEKECKENFWDRHPEAQKFVEANAIPPREAMCLFSDFLVHIERHYPHIVIVSDNPSFDIAWIDYYLNLYADRKPLRYSSLDGSYKMVWDSVSIQKSWLCLKTPESKFYSPPKGHREQLKLQSDYPHDHNPLNDARNIATFYIQTIDQMKHFRESLPKPVVTKNIKLEEYDHKWKGFFLLEKQAIQSAFEELDITESLLDILHVGSTSVEGLTAKPIIDIIVVTKNTDLIDNPLSIAGYRYKGEYNIPMRKMYGKNTGYEVYLHAYEEGHPEIELNLMFRDYLRENHEAREEYSQLKKSIIEKSSIHSKVASTGITTYNLEKNEFIQNILIKAGFRELCMRLCTQNSEWEEYNSIKESYFAKLSKIQSTKIDDINQKHLVLYKGTQVVGAAQIQLSAPNAFLSFLDLNDKVMPEEDLSSRSYFLNNIEKWIKKLGVIFFTTSVNSKQLPFYEAKDYKVMGSQDDDIYMLKSFLSPVEHEIESMPASIEVAGEVDSSISHEGN